MMKSKREYSKEELEAMEILDLLADAKASIRQSRDGPFYPEKNITRATCLEYAERCITNAIKGVEAFLEIVMKEKERDETTA